MTTKTRKTETKQNHKQVQISVKSVSSIQQSYVMSN